MRSSSGHGSGCTWKRAPRTRRRPTPTCGPGSPTWTRCCCPLWTSTTTSTWTGSRSRSRCRRSTRARWAGRCPSRPGRATLPPTPRGVGKILGGERLHQQQTAAARQAYQDARARWVEAETRRLRQLAAREQAYEDNTRRVPRRRSPGTTPRSTGSPRRWRRGPVVGGRVLRDGARQLGLPGRLPAALPAGVPAEAAAPADRVPPAAGRGDPGRQGVPLRPGPRRPAGDPPRRAARSAAGTPRSSPRWRCGRCTRSSRRTAARWCRRCSFNGIVDTIDRRTGDFVRPVPGVAAHRPGHVRRDQAAPGRPGRLPQAPAGRPVGPAGRAGRHPAAAGLRPGGGPGLHRGVQRAGRHRRAAQPAHPAGRRVRPAARRPVRQHGPGDGRRDPDRARAPAGRRSTRARSSAARWWSTRCATPRPARPRPTRWPAR